MTLNGVNGADNSGKPIQAYEGISVDTIKEKGSKADVRAINIYDTNNDGYLTGAEVSVFNNTQRTLSDDGKTLTITNQQDGKNQEYKITSSNDLLDSQYRVIVEDNGNYKHVHEGVDIHEGLQEMRLFENGIKYMQSANVDNDDYSENVMHGDISLGENGKVDINVDTGKVYIEGAEGTSNSVGGARIDLTIKDSEIERISVNNSDVTLDGVHDRTLFFETDTDVSLKGKSTLNQNNSSIDVNEE